MARDIDRQLTGIQVRVGVLSDHSALGTRVTQAVR
jgi:hypothetical protein